jgi:hypothetical protein
MAPAHLNHLSVSPPRALTRLEQPVLAHVGCVTYFSTGRMPSRQAFVVASSSDPHLHRNLHAVSSTDPSCLCTITHVLTVSVFIHNLICQY